MNTFLEQAIAEKVAETHSHQWALTSRASESAILNELVRCGVVRKARMKVGLRGRDKVVFTLREDQHERESVDN